MFFCIGCGQATHESALKIINEVINLENYKTILLDNPFNLISQKDSEILAKQLARVPKYELTIFFKFFLHSSDLLPTYFSDSELVKLLQNFQLVKVLLEFLEYRKICFSRCYEYENFFEIFYSFDPTPAVSTNLSSYISKNKSIYTEVPREIEELIHRFEETHPEMCPTYHMTRYHEGLDKLREDLQKNVQVLKNKED